MKILKWILAIVILLLLGYFLGPQAENPDFNTSLLVVTADLNYLEDSINGAEGALNNLKPDNQSRIIWADSSYQKTPYSIVYLHGFSASQEEGDPLHTELAERYGCNLFLARLAGHGLTDKEAMLDLTAEYLVESAKRSIAIGKQLGEKVILVTTSTGGTLGLYLAQKDPDIEALVLYSPNIDIFDPNSRLLTRPWGLQLARAVTGGKYYESKLDTARTHYWTNKYRLEALIELRLLVDNTMTTTTFENIDQPVLLGYYYENDAAMDSTVSVKAMLEMYDQLGTPVNQKRKVAFPNVRHHVIASHLTSKDLESVRQETYAFLEEVVELVPVDAARTVEN